jgi:hypothetical protein
MHVQCDLRLLVAPLAGMLADRPACCSFDPRACLKAQRILKLEYELPPRIAVSPEAHSLLAAMLVAQPEQRISIQQAGCSAWQDATQAPYVLAHTAGTAL